MQNWKRNFFTIWAGQAFSLIGSSVAGFALIWWMTQETGSATILATAALVSALPAVILGPFVGALVDRWNRRLVMIVADGIIALLTLVIVLLFAGGHIQIWHIFVLNFARSLGGTFHWTSMQASTSLMVPKDQLSRVAGMNQTLGGVLSIAAPPLGALLLGLIPMYWVLSIDVITAIIAITPLLFIMIPQPQRSEPAEVVTPRRVWTDVREGLRYVMAWPGMMIIMGIAAVINFLLTPAGILIPLIVTKHFGGGVWHLGAVESAFSAGMIVGGLGLSIWGGFKKRVFTSLIGLIFMGVGPLLIGIAPANAFWLAIAGQAIGGLFNPIVNGPLFALLQDKIAPEMQGRVFTLVGSLSGAMAPLGLAIAGPIAERFGLQVWFMMGGIACMALGAGALLIPAVRNLEDDKYHTAVAKAVPSAALSD